MRLGHTRKLYDTTNSGMGGGRWAYVVFGSERGLERRGGSASARQGPRAHKCADRRWRVNSGCRMNVRSGQMSRQIRPKSAMRIVVARIWRCRRVEGGRKAKRVNRAAAYAWLTR
jgi:hypothetical protein